MAIAFDAITNSPTGSTDTSRTFSHTITGTNPILFVEAYIVLDPSTVSCTYNGVSMTQIGTTQNAGNVYHAMFYLKSPATGANNVVFTSTNSRDKNVNAFSYTGADQTSPLDASDQQVFASVTSWAQSLTTVADNCWVVMTSASQSGRFQTAGANTTLRSVSSNLSNVFDSNAAKTPAGSVTLNGNVTSGPDAGVPVYIASFKPAVAAATNSNFFQFF